MARSSPPPSSRRGHRSRSATRRSSTRRDSRPRSRSRSRSRGRSAGRSARRSPPRRDRRRRSPSYSSSSSSSGSSASSRSRSPSRSRSRGRARRRSRSVSSSRSRSRSRSRSVTHHRRDEQPKRSVTPPRRQPAPAAARAEATTRKRERSPSTDRKKQKEQKTQSPPMKKKQEKSVTPTRDSDATDAKDTELLTRRSLSGERSPPRKRRESSLSRRPKNEPETPPSKHSDEKADATPPRASTRSPEKKRSSSGDRTPPRASNRSTRSESGDRTPPRKTRQKRSERQRHKRRSSSSDSDSDSGSSDSKERTPPRRSRTTKPDKERRRDTRRPATEKHTNASATETAPSADVTLKRVNLFANDAKSGRTGGVYLPPFKLAQLRASVSDTSSPEYQRQTWDALRKSINGLINKVNVSNLSQLLPELFQENLVRARGLLARAVMKAQLASPGFTHIYAALVAVLNTKMPENGELVVKRVVHRFRRAFKRGDKVVAIALARFIAHLVNQQVVHELLALEVLTLLLANPTDDSVEVAVNFTKECGQLLAELCPEGLRAIFERFRGILHEGEIDKRVQYTIEGLFAIRKGGFADYPAVHAQLDLVESGDQITHETTLDEAIDREDALDVFRVDPDYAKNEAMWAAIKKEILGESDDESGASDGDDGSDEDEDEDDDMQQQQSAAGNTVIQDMTEQDLVNLRRTIYLTIMSSMSHEECAHKLLRLNIRAGQEKEICAMLLECCSQERTYLRYYGLLGQRFCMLKREYQDACDACFAEQYALIHRLETNKLRNVAKFFAHLLMTDALPWTVFEYVRLNEEETTSSSRIFIKILCQELSEHMGLKKLQERFTDPFMARTFAGLFPTDNPRNTRFAINFFTSIGLGGLTADLREHLKNAPKIIMAQANPTAAASSSSDSSSDSDSDSSSSSSSSSSSGSSSDSSDSSDSD